MHRFVVVQQWGAKCELCNDRTDLARCRGNAVRGGAIAGGEGFSRDDKRGRVWAKILKEVCQAVQEDESVLARNRGIEGNVSKGYRTG